MKPVFAIVHKDIAIEFRNKESISSMFWFGLLVLVIFSFSFDSTGCRRHQARDTLGCLFICRHPGVESFS